MVPTVASTNANRYLNSRGHFKYSLQFTDCHWVSHTCELGHVIFMPPAHPLHICKNSYEENSISGPRLFRYLLALVLATVGTML